MLTNAAVKAARPRAAAYKRADGRGLILYVAPTGLKSFRWRFYLGGREQLLTIGSWPEITLDQARAARDRAQARLDRGEDPRARANDAGDAPSTFEPAARAWHAHRLVGWSRQHAADVIESLERDVFPAIGTMPLAAITAPVVLQVLRAVEGRSRIETARRIQQRMKAVFAYARSEGWATDNPAVDVVEAMAPGRAVRQQPALVDVAHLRALLAAVDLVTAAPAAKLASRFLALTAVRFAAMRGARWDEIEDLDGEAPVWRIPAARMKLATAKKLDAANDHLVPMSAAAIAVLRAARNLHPENADADAGGLIFTGRAGAAIGENAIRDLYVRAGYGGRHVPHGWRASFSTILNERLPEERGAIDRALAHAGSKEEAELKINRKVEGAYNRAQHLGPRRRLFDTWAEILTADATAVE